MDVVYFPLKESLEWVNTHILVFVFIRSRIYTATLPSVRSLPDPTGVGTRYKYTLITGSLVRVEYLYIYPG
jgi:hypothetical protein